MSNQMPRLHGRGTRNWPNRLTGPAPLTIEVGHVVVVVVVLDVVLVVDVVVVVVVAAATNIQQQQHQEHQCMVLKP